MVKLQYALMMLAALAPIIIASIIADLTWRRFAIVGAALAVMLGAAWECELPGLLVAIAVFVTAYSIGAGIRRWRSGRTITEHEPAQIDFVRWCRRQLGSEGWAIQEGWHIFDFAARHPSAGRRLFVCLSSLRFLSPTRIKDLNSAAIRADEVVVLIVHNGANKRLVDELFDLDVQMVDHRDLRALQDKPPLRFLKRRKAGLTAPSGMKAEPPEQVAQHSGRNIFDTA